MSDLRLFQLLALLQSRRFWGGPELAERLEITPRTLRRDIDELRSLGYAVEATSGPGGGYQMSRGSDLPPLILDDDEALAVSVALQAAPITFDDLGESTQRALAKLEQFLPQKLKDRLNALSTTTVSVGGSSRAVSARQLSDAASACKERRFLTFDYENQRAERALRHVDPYRLARTGSGRWYLLGWDRDRRDFRLFRLDRMRNLKVSDTCFTPRPLPEGQDMGDYIAARLASGTYQIHVRVRVFGEFRKLTEELPHWAGILEVESPRSCLLTVSANSENALVCVLLVLDREFELLEPRSFATSIDVCRKRLKNALDACPP